MNKVVNDRPIENWIHALDAADLNDRPKVVKLDGRQVVLFKSGTDIFACNNRCPHEGYPLAEGVLSDGCILTCNWHNWKFDLRSGATIVGGDRLRRYPVKVYGGRLYVDIADPPLCNIVEDAISDLLDSFDEHDYTRMAREIARIIKADGDPVDAVTAAVNETHDRFEFGMTHAIAAAADWLYLYNAAAGDPTKQLVCITEIVGHLAWDTRRETSYPYAGSMRAFNANEFLRSIELQDEDTAMSLLQGALCVGYKFGDLYEYLARAALAHYQDFGHSLIYVLKARQFVRRTDGHTLEPVLLMLVRSLIYATREDLIPQFKAYRPTLSGWKDGDGGPDGSVLREGGVSEVLSEIKKCSGGSDGLLQRPVRSRRVADAAHGYRLFPVDIGAGARQCRLAGFHARPDICQCRPHRLQRFSRFMATGTVANRLFPRAQRQIHRQDAGYGPVARG